MYKYYQLLFNLYLKLYVYNKYIIIKNIEFDEH